MKALGFEMETALKRGPFAKNKGGDVGARFYLWFEFSATMNVTQWMPEAPLVSYWALKTGPAIAPIHPDRDSMTTLPSLPSCSNLATTTFWRKSVSAAATKVSHSSSVRAGPSSAKQAILLPFFTLPS